MSFIAFPFKNESLDVLAANLQTAARHDAVRQVWAIAAEDSESIGPVAAAAEEIWKTESTPVIVLRQQRLGMLRGGKGDGMNTGIRAAAEAGVDRLHFYDADISNFDSSWIDGAEAAADKGFAVVRHRFPRSSTDAMITWMITRPSLAMFFPATVLPKLGQPLGGEMLLTGPVIEALAADSHVVARSDWGVDTVLTHATSTLGVPLYEHNVVDGKRHALYGSLDELRDMVVECLDAVASLQRRPSPPDDVLFDRDPPAPVPDDLKEVVAYDVEKTIPLLVEGWSDDERRLADDLPQAIVGELRANEDEPSFDYMDAEVWSLALRHLLENFDLSSDAWKALAFRLWLTRVLAYTTGPAQSGYDAAIGYLESTIRQYEAASDHHGLG